MMRLFDSQLSGNSWKVRILLNQMEIAYERITLDLLRGDTQTPAFKKISRFARVPVLQLDDGRSLVESSAILLYLAQDSRFLPSDPYERAQVTSWLSFEQGDLQKPLALCRVYHKRGLVQAMVKQIEQYHSEGHMALEKLELWLTDRPWLVGDTYTVADLGVFCYVSLAGEGGFDMTPYPAIARWLARAKQQPGWIDLL